MHFMFSHLKIIYCFPLKKMRISASLYPQSRCFLSFLHHFHSPNIRVACLHWASLVAQWQGTCLPMQETWFQSLGREDPLEKEMLTRSSILAWEIPWTGIQWWALVRGVSKSQTQLSDLACMHTFTVFVVFFNAWFFWQCSIACRILVLPHGIKSTPTAEAQNLSPWTAKESPSLYYYDSIIQLMFTNKILQYAMIIFPFLYTILVFLEF